MKERISITIDSELLERLDRIAESSRESRSALIERLLLEGVTEEEMLVNPFVQCLLKKTLSSPSIVESLLDALKKINLNDNQLGVIKDKLKSMQSFKKK